LESVVQPSKQGTGRGRKTSGWSRMDTLRGYIQDRFGRGLTECNAEGMTPILQAVRECDMEAIFLVRVYMTMAVEDEQAQHEIIVARDVDGNTILHWAAQTFNPSIMSGLLESEPATEHIVNAQNNKSLTPLHCYVIAGDKSSLGLLLSRGALINSTTKDGYTPLHLASYFGKTDVVRFLLDNAADLYARDNDGIDALGFAKQQGAQSTVELLEASHTLDSRQQQETKSGHRPALAA
jgi:ankyrin repeat protein